MPDFRPLPLSHTKGSKFRRCRLAFWRQYGEHRPDPSGIPAAVGKGFHAWADEAGAQPDADESALYRILARKAALLDERAAPLLRALVSRYIQRGGLPPVPPDAEDVVREQALAVTAAGEPCAWDSPDAVFRARLDLAWTEHGTLGCIRDWKTSRTIEDVDATDQMRWYAGALSLLNPALEQVHCELYYVRFAPGGVRRTPEPYQADELRATVPEEWRAIAEEMERCAAAGDWPATLGDGCRYCPYRGDCPAYQRAVPPVRPFNGTEQAVEAADCLLRLKGQVKDYDAALREWTLHHGAIVCSNGELLGHHAGEKRSVCDTEAAAMFLEGAGVGHEDLWSALHLGITAVEKLARGVTQGSARGQKKQRVDALLAELAEMGATRTVTATEFSRKKPAAEEADDDLDLGEDFGPGDE